MSLDLTTLIDRVASHAAATGHFERVNQHEPKSAPGNGLSAAVWVQRVQPHRSSGLAATSALVTLMLRMYSNMLQEPQDEIDPRIGGAVDAVITALSGDFELGGNARCVDLLGQGNPGVAAQAGYLTIGTTMYRVMDISVPIIVNDVWSQAV
ncbi:MAG TPA: hypothetical protein VFC00_02615 [Micromonosporaceae bacterium]|nr:hypothetical protein [Micromonosporaceae bacterium]